MPNPLEAKAHIKQVENVYNQTASGWVRSEPVCLSDFTGRPPTLDLLEPVQGLRILDLGCGEGYCARLLKESGAGEILGIDLSGEMISRARATEATEKRGIEYRTGDATHLDSLADQSFDRVVAVFLFNYIKSDEMELVMKEVHRILKPGGRFVFSVPHPMLAFSRRKEAPFYFDPGTHGYFSGRNQMFEGRIWRRDGKALEVRSIHKTLEDYFEAMQAAGFKKMPRIKELKVTAEMIALDTSFFSPVNDLPLHLAIAVEKTSG